MPATARKPFSKSREPPKAGTPSSVKEKVQATTGTPARAGALAYVGKPAQQKAGFHVTAGTTEAAARTTEIIGQDHQRNEQHQGRYQQH